jgi:hypothetical protein
LAPAAVVAADAAGFIYTVMKQQLILFAWRQLAAVADANNMIVRSSHRQQRSLDLL